MRRDPRSPRTISGASKLSQLAPAGVVEELSPCVHGPPRQRSLPCSISRRAASVTDPQVASVGVTQSQVESGEVVASAVMLPLATNARAKMQGITDGFVKFFCRPGSGTVLGVVVVAPTASELIMPISIAVQHGLTVDQIAHTFAIYPSLSGSVTEAARRLMLHGSER